MKFLAPVSICLCCFALACALLYFHREADPLLASLTTVLAYFALLTGIGGGAAWLVERVGRPIDQDEASAVRYSKGGNPFDWHV